MPQLPPGSPPTLDDLIEAWRAALDTLEIPANDAIRQAKPIGFELGVIVFRVPSERCQWINALFRNDGAEIERVMEISLGFQPLFLSVQHEVDAPDRPKVGSLKRWIPDWPE